jgi:phosphate transport system substrate-binding protein
MCIGGIGLLVACATQPPSDPVVVDGSSTVFPLSEAVALDFLKANRSAQVSARFSGTVEGMQRFCRGAIDVAGASRPITVQEQNDCAAAGVSFVELPVAHDAITLIVHTRNTWASSITVKELRTLWAPEATGKITRWSQIRPGWPDREIVLVGPGRESGTFDYFTAAINESAGASRSDYAANADDREIVRVVSSTENALGYVGYSYFERNRNALRALAIDDLDDRIGRGPIEPSAESVRRGVYRPLSRPLFIYVNAARLQRPEVKAFVSHYLRRAGELAEAESEIALIGTAYELARQRLDKVVTGTMYTTQNAADMRIESLLTQ